MSRYFSAVFVLLFVFANTIGILRYVFRYGDPSTSPTYDSTPMEFFLLWKGLILLMCLIAIAYVRIFSMKLLIYYLIAVIFITISYFQLDSFYAQGAARALVLSGFLFLVLYSNSWWINIEHFNKAIEFMTVLGIVFLAIQIFQFQVFDILPSHSHAGHLIRFGSFYDDSLALGMLLPMFAGYYFYKYNNVASLALTGIVFNFIAILTGSMTAVGVAIIYTIWVYRTHSILLLSYLILCLTGILYFWSKLVEIVTFKSESIQLHMEGFEKLQRIDLLSITGLRPVDIFTESGFVFLLLNFGVIVLLLLLTLHILTIKASKFLISKDELMFAFAGATEGLSISVLLYNLTLPAIIIPPAYLAVSILSAIVLSRYKQNIYLRH